jgi:hypothetical protein
VHQISDKQLCNPDIFVTNTTYFFTLFEVCVIVTGGRQNVQKMHFFTLFEVVQFQSSFIQKGSRLHYLKYVL